MESEKKHPQVNVRIIKAAPPEQPVTKAETPTQIDAAEERTAGAFVPPPYPLLGLKELVDGSNILPQCIEAYKNNIAGFGIALRYTVDDSSGDETPEMKAEWDRAQEILDLLNLDMDTKEVFEDLIVARETYGIGYLEVIRNPANEVNQIVFIRDTPSMTKTCPLDPPVEVDYNYKGLKTIKRARRFCKYKQVVGGKTVYFKEFGDPRIMDNRNGEYTTVDEQSDDESEKLPLQYQANEIMEFAIGTDLYGEVRWKGQILGVDGARKAENLNNTYFSKGRHTPLMIMVKGGTLTNESFTKLKEYMNDIQGEAGQHAFLVLEVENTDNQPGFDEAAKPEIEVKDLASILQKDELFQDYIENGRKRVQSSFRLPDLYVGYTTDFNRATAQTAMEVTEEQVFQPERKSLAWAINNRLLNGYGFKYVECYFAAPDLSNPDDIYKIFSAADRAGGVTPNMAKNLVGKMMGEKVDPFEGDWADIPIAAKDLISSMNPQAPAMDMDDILSQLSGQITKAAEHNDDAIVAVMKEVRNLLLNMGGDRGIIKGNPDQPRDDDGKFASTGGGSSSGSDSSSETKTKYAPSERRNNSGITISPKKFAKLCGTLNTRFPGLQAGERRNINDASKGYRVEADGYGGMTILSSWKLKSKKK